MKAKDFVRKFGWELVQRDITCLDTGFIKKEDFLEHYGFDILDDLKRYVNAYELVESYGGLESAKKFVGSEYRKLSQPKTYNRLCEAISDVESCK